MGLLEAFLRKKRTDDDGDSGPKLARVLTVVDLTVLGVGSTLGAGIYVLSGEVGRTISGPSVILAFLIAALSSILSGLCYAEFGARVPKAGSGYVYSYVTMGELCAFTIGWNLVLSYVVGASSVAKAWSSNLDTMIGCKFRELTVKLPYTGGGAFEEYPDIFAASIIIILALLLAAGAKEFAIVNKVFTGVNIGVILFVIVAGLTQISFSNWSLDQNDVYNIALNSTMNTGHNTDTLNCKERFPGPHAEDNTANIENGAGAQSCGNGLSDEACFLTLNDSSQLTTDYWPGVGGFMPYGFQGVLSGTATCFYAFVGFDAIATTGEEAINPQRNIPLGIIFSLLICCVSYLTVSGILTLMVPYLLLDKAAPLPVAFASGGMPWAKWVVGIGAVCALTASLLGCMFPLPRIVYAMADDGLIFRGLGKVSKKSQTPVIATLVMASLAAILAAIFDLKELIDFMSIGTLMAYTLVAASVMILRYRPAECDLALTKDYGSPSFGEYFKPQSDSPTERTSTAVSNMAALFGLISVIHGFALNKLPIEGMAAQGMAFVIPLVLLIIIGVGVSRQPQSTEELGFSVPAVPWIPLINVWVNVYLMCSLPASIWVKLTVWLGIGYAIYIFYGVSHSSAKEQPEKDSAALLKDEIKSDEI